MSGGDDVHDASPFVPNSRSVARLRAAAADCQGCELYASATQTVFGAGARTAALLLVGEQPGDQEDRRGEPFVGPAGHMLDRCLADAGIEPGDVYLTNAVKHFRFERRGVRRLHKRPTSEHVEACHPWREAELRAVAAHTVVALGAVAARSLLGRTMAIEANRRTWFELGSRQLLITYHPSAVPRADERAALIRRRLVDDLRLAADASRQET